MDYFNDVQSNFLGHERVSCVVVYVGSESSQMSSKMGEDEWRYYGMSVSN